MVVSVLLLVLASPAAGQVRVSSILLGVTLLGVPLCLAWLLNRRRRPVKEEAEALPDLASYEPFRKSFEELEASLGEAGADGLFLIPAVFSEVLAADLAELPELAGRLAGTRARPARPRPDNRGLLTEMEARVAEAGPFSGDPGKSGW